MTALGAFRTGAGVVERPGTPVLRFRGPQALWFLDQLVTNRVVDLPAGAGADALLLTPKGRITALLHLWVTGEEEVFAVVDAGPDPGAAGTLRAFFEGRVFATRVVVDDLTDAVALVTVLGPRAGEVVGAALATAGRAGPEPVTLPAGEEHANLAVAPGDPPMVVARAVRPVAGYELLVPAARAEAVVAALFSAGGEACSAEDLGRLSVVEGLPRYGRDFDERFLPQEAALERAVHFAKGCYLGQEAVAMAQRGRVKRRLRHLAFDGPPVAGVPTTEGRPAGEMTSLGDEDGRGWAIAWVPTAVEVGTAVEVVPAEGASAGAPARAEVRELPGTHTGPRAPSARELRERLTGAGGVPGTP
jgi:folate-binding protein YgfZ